MSGRARPSGILAMAIPVRCAHCSTVYDMTRVEVRGRWMDCTSWISPCCSRQVDDRGETGILGPHRRHYERLSAREAQRLAARDFEVDMYGRMRPVRWV